MHWDPPGLEEDETSPLMLDYPAAVSTSTRFKRLFSPALIQPAVMFVVAAVCCAISVYEAISAFFPDEAPSPHHGNHTVTPTPSLPSPDPVPS